MKKISTIVTASLVVLTIYITMMPLVKTQTDEWSEPQQLTTDPADAHYPSIMQDSTGKIWLVWARDEPDWVGLWYKTSSDGGANWSEEKRFGLCGQANYRIFGTSLLQDSTGRIWVAWGGGPTSSQDIFYITSDDGGTLWSCPQQLTDYPGDDCTPSLIEVPCGEVWIVFRSWGLSYNDDIWYKKTSDGGATWSEPVQLTSHPTREFVPDALVDSAGKIWVVWSREVEFNENNIYGKTSIDNGVSWSEDQELTTHLGYESGPSIIEDVSGRIFVFYRQTYEDMTYDIWYKTTVDGGNTWSGYEELTADTYHNYCPCAALINDEVWVVWNSDRSGNFDIWLAKRIPAVLYATVDIDPDTLNLKSNGQWISASIELPAIFGYSVIDIDASTVKLNNTIPVDLGAPTEIGDYDSDSIPDLMVKFERAAVIEWLGTVDYGEDTEKSVEVTIAITGEVAGTPFEGVDAVRVLLKG